MTHEYPRGLRGPVVQDVALGIMWVLFLAWVDVPAGVRALMLGAIPIVFAWGLVTLHFPSRVEIDADGVAFARYGRVHRFAWKDVERVRVRRFLVRDRVLVRIEPSGGAWRGKYWVVDSIGELEKVVAELETRGSAKSLKVLDPAPPWGQRLPPGDSGSPPGDSGSPSGDSRSPRGDSGCR